MERKHKIQQLLNRLDDLQAKDPVGSISRLLEEEQMKAREAVNSPSSTALKVLAKSVANVQNDPRPQKMQDDLEEAKEDITTKMQELSDSFAEKLQSLVDEVSSVDGKGQELTRAHASSLLERLTEYKDTFATEMQSLATQGTALETEVGRISLEIPKIYKQIAAIPDPSPSIQQNTESVSRATQNTENVAKDLDALRKDLTNRMNQLSQHGGGNANRSFLVGGDANTLKYFTDINLKAGPGTTISYAANQTTKFTDITITATGSGSGITRSIQTVATNTAAANSPSIDYVYLASGTTTITLPTTVGNTNLYTIKNIGAGTVTINTTGGETIDGSSNLILPLQFTSVDLISNNSGNWDIT